MVTAYDLSAWREASRLTRRQAAGFFHVSEACYRQWERGLSPLPDEIDRMFEEAKGIARWATQPRPCNPPR